MTIERGNLRFLGRPGVKGLRPDIVEDIHDITRKFGQVDVGDQVIRFRSGNLDLGYELFTSAPIKPLSLKAPILLVAKSIVPRGGMEFIRTDQGLIIWHKQLTAKEAENVVRVIDRDAKGGGLIDEAGKRSPFPPELSIANPSKYNVEEVFGRGDASFMVPPGQDPKKFLERFDDPDKLSVVGTPVGGFVIVRKDQMPSLQRREHVARELLLSRGIDINDPGSIGRLSVNEILELKKEIKQRLVQE